MTAPTALWTTQTLAGIGGTIAALEILRSWRSFADGGFYDWRLLRTDTWLGRNGRGTAVLDRLFHPRVMMAMTLARLACSLVLIAGTPGARAAAGAALLVLTALFHIRAGYGLDGSDQMQVVILGGVSAWAALDRLGTLQAAAPAFIAAQAVLAYSTAGWAKLVSPVWRSGGAMVGIFNTRSYGFRAVAALLLDYRALATIAAWSVILFEVLSPLAVLSPTLCGAFIAAGVVFHGSCAGIMGLNLFFWSFLATYPSLWLGARLVHDRLAAL